VKTKIKPAALAYDLCTYGKLVTSFTSENGHRRLQVVQVGK